MKTSKVLYWIKISGLTVIILLITLILLFTILTPIITTYNVTVNTERISFETLDINNSRLVFSGGQIANIDSILYNDFEGSFELRKNTEVTIERISNGPVSIIIESKKGDELGQLYRGSDGSKVFVAKEFIEIFIDDIERMTTSGQTFVFPVDGAVEIGRSVDIETFGESTAVLRNGKITLIGNSFFGGKHFIAGSHELFLGDKLIFEKQENKSFGFALINDEPGMQVSFRTRAKEARVIKPGPRDDDTGVNISANWIDRLIKDEFCRSISFFTGIILIAITLIAFVFDFQSFLKDS